ncbi:hypothetical protein HWV62_25778 [Athelia sp. TMB]|nr:hypothetical protein HWV62_25778 [Athelia sp. TMB]
MFLRLLLHPETVANVVVCGRVGSGKSSLVNMLVGQDCAKIDGSASAYTSTATAYDAPRLQDGSTTKIWDTPGLDGTVKELKKTMCSIKSQIDKVNGVFVVIFCHGLMQGRITEELMKASSVMESVLANVPSVTVALVVTGLELTADWEAWWRENRAHFKKLVVNYDHHACITTTKGDLLSNDEGYRYKSEYQRSADAVRAMLRECLRGDKPDRTAEIKHPIKDDQGNCLSLLFG